MSNDPALWISEAEVVALMDLPQAIDALEDGLRQQAQGAALNMGKTHVAWSNGGTLHAIGAAFESAQIVGTKSWAHTPGGATPLLLLWHAETGALLSIVEAFALGQMRTGAMSGVATRRMAAADADCFALFGTGKQALAQLAAVAAVRPLRTVRIWGRDRAKQALLAERAGKLGYPFEVEQPTKVEQAAQGASILTLATRAREPFLTRAMVAAGSHINAIGAITPEREEFSQDVLADAGLIAADDPEATRRLSRELRHFFDEDESGWARVQPVSALIANPPGHDAGKLSVFKAMGMGISDLALGVEIFRRACAAGCGRHFLHPEKAAPRLGPTQRGTAP